MDILLSAPAILSDEKLAGRRKLLILSNLMLRGRMLSDRGLYGLVISDCILCGTETMLSVRVSIRLSGRKSGESSDRFRLSGRFGRAGGAFCTLILLSGRHCSSHSSLVSNLTVILFLFPFNRSATAITQCQVTFCFFRRSCTWMIILRFRLLRVVRIWLFVLLRRAGSIDSTRHGGWVDKFIASMMLSGLVTRRNRPEANWPPRLKF
jgi:hypothetical protein